MGRLLGKKLCRKSCSAISSFITMFRHLRVVPVWHSKLQICSYKWRVSSPEETFEGSSPCAIKKRTGLLEHAGVQLQEALGLFRVIWLNCTKDLKNYGQS